MDPTTEIYKTLTGEITKAEGDNNRKFLVRISTSDPDRSNDIVIPKGGKFENYLRNSVVLFGHKQDEPPVARCLELRVGEKSIDAVVEFPEEGKYPFADYVCALVQQKVLNALSIGFMPVIWEERKDENGFGYTFKEWELFEFSFVTIPANPNALRLQGFDDTFVQKALDLSKTPVKKDVAEVVNLAYILSDLNWLMRAFVNNKVSEDVTSKLASAIVLIMECIKSEAVLGKKDFAREIAHKDLKLDELFAAIEKDVLPVITKEGRVLSDANKKLILSCIEQMGAASKSLQELADATNKEEPKKEAESPEEKKSNISIIVSELTRHQKKADKHTGLSLHLLKQLREATQSNTATKGSTPTEEGVKK
jgi:HK97 family phage prohead protease